MSSDENAIPNYLQILDLEQQDIVQEVLEPFRTLFQQTIYTFSNSPYFDEFRDQLELIASGGIETAIAVNRNVADETQVTCDSYEPIRRHMDYLCRWLEFGYSMITYHEDEDKWIAAATAMDRFGIMTTLLDDLADTDKWDALLSPGNSDKFARYLSFYFKNRKHHPQAKLEPLETEEVKAFKHILQYFSQFDSYIVQKIEENDSEIQPQLFNCYNNLIRALTGSIPIQRRVRKRVKENKALVRDLETVLELLPHGMTIAMVGFTNIINRPDLAEDIEFFNEFMQIALKAQKAGQLSNTIATYEREIKAGELNEGAMKAMIDGTIQQSDYIKEKPVDYVTEPPLSEQLELMKGGLSELLNELYGIAQKYKLEESKYQFVMNFLFGLHSLNSQYMATMGRV